jgi:DNA-binding YbaB/EbfC family protein
MSENFDMNALLQQAMDMQSQLAQAQEQAAQQIVEGSAGAGLVTVSMTGAGEVTKIRIDPGVVDPSDVSMLEDLVLAALHDAAHKATALQQQAMGSLGNNILGGGGLGGLLGGS